MIFFICSTSYIFNYGFCTYLLFFFYSKLLLVVEKIYPMQLLPDRRNGVLLKRKSV